MTPNQPPRGPITFGSLFSGIGGLDLGLERAGMVCRWQCEIDPYATKVLEKHWPHVKRYSDVRTITEPEPVDLICGGVPCQPWSVAGKRRGQDDARDLWPEFWRVCLLVQPRFILVEEVPGFAVAGGLGRALTDLACAGFDAEWFHLSAADVGAPHLRKRLFVVAYANGGGLRQSGIRAEQSRRAETVGASEGVADSIGNGRESRRESDAREGSRGREPHRGDSGADNMANSDGPRLAHGRSAGVAAREEQLPHAAAQRCGDSWWTSEPDVGRVANGVPSRVDRLRCLGNAVVPQVAEAIGRMIVRAAQ